jgi:hypothetical protein
MLFELFMHDLECSLPVEVYFLDGPNLLELAEKLVQHRFVGDAAVLQDVFIGLDIVWGFTKVRNEIKDVYLFHVVVQQPLEMAVAINENEDQRFEKKSSG